MITDYRLHSFFSVWRLKSYTRAAEFLHLTQPAVSQHIRALEEELGRPLFALRGRTLALTPEGAVLLRFAETVEADAQRTIERVARISDRRKLRFGATRTIGEYALPACLASWLRDRPSDEVFMTVDNSDVLFGSLASGSLDFAFVEGTFDRDSYDADVLVRDSMVAVCAPSHPLAGRSISLGEVLSETLLLREALVETALAAHNRGIRSFARVLEIGNIGAIKRLAASGVGVAFLYGRSVADELARGELARIDLTDCSIDHDYSFVCLKRSLYAADYRAFFDHCRAEIAGNAGS